MSSKVLLINPSYNASYGGSKASIVNPVAPTLGLATIAATALQRGHDVEILDMSWRPYNFELVRDQILKNKPDIIGITATTPLINQLRDMSVLIKDISKDIIVVGGGSHPSALPYETLQESKLDAVFVGESDYSFADICDEKPLSDIPGLVYRDKEKVLSAGIRTGEFFWDLYYALKFYLLPATSNLVKSVYYSKERWPKHDFKKQPPKPANYQIVKKTNFKANEKLDSRI